MIAKPNRLRYNPKTLLFFVFLLLLNAQCNSGRLSGYEVHGIDVSKYQQHIFWSTVQIQPIDFVFIKSTEGKALKDPNFEENWRGAAEAELIRGAYHFFIPTVDPLLQARQFISNTPLKTGDLPPVIDLEIRGPQPLADYQQDISIFSAALEAHYGIRPILYSSLRDYQDYLQKAFPDHVFWLAYYQRRPPTKALNIPWIFWQYTDKGSLRGITGPVDLNVFRGTKQGLQALTIGYRPEQ